MDLTMPLSPAAKEKKTRTQISMRSTQMSGSITVDDVYSSSPGSHMAHFGPPIGACIIGDVVYQMKDGQKKTEVEGARNPHLMIMSGMYTKFMDQKELAGQANLTLLIDSERNYKLLSQTIYVPGCAPFHGGGEIPPAAKEFCEQVKSAVETVPLSELTIGNANVEWMIFEVVIGRDPEFFPRYGTRFNGFFKVDRDGNVTDGEHK